MIDFSFIKDYAYVLFGCAGLLVGFGGRAYSIMQRIALLEQKLASVDKDISETRAHIDKLETQIFQKLNSIDEKLDNFIIRTIENGIK
jgi:hypothetical protein